MTFRADMAVGKSKANGMSSADKCGRGGGHAYMYEQIQCLGSRAHHDVLAKLNLRCELFRDEAGAQLNCLKGAQWQLAWGVDYVGDLRIAN